MTIKTNLSILLLAMAFAVVACTPQQQQQVADTLTEDDTMQEVKMEGENTMEEDSAMEEDKKMNADDLMEEGGEDKVEDEAMMEEKNEPVSFSGTILAGSSSPLIDFNKADYDKALDSGKVVILYFYANWCPSCRAEFPKMQSAFNKLIGDDVVGFRVSFKDNETNAQEEALAKQFGVAYQHTKIALKNGEKVLKAPDSWDEQRYLDEINKLTN